MSGEAIAVAVGVEVAKALLMLAIQQAQRAGMTTDQVMALYLSEKAKFEANDPAKIPEV